MKCASEEVKVSMKEKKTLSVMFVIVIASVLLAMSMPAAYAKPPLQISGRLVGSSLTLLDMKIAGGNVFFDLNSHGTYVSGDILGDFEQNSMVVVHYGDPEIAKNHEQIPIPQRPEADFNWIKADRVFTGTVLGVSGGLTIRLEANGYGNSMRGPAYYDLEGTWVIISGTGGLKNLHGQGTWWHTRTGFAGIEYEGQVHFDP